MPAPESPQLTYEDPLTGYDVCRALLIASGGVGRLSAIRRMSTLSVWVACQEEIRAYLTPGRMLLSNYPLQAVDWTHPVCGTEREESAPQCRLCGYPVDREGQLCEDCCDAEEHD